MSPDLIRQTVTLVRRGLPFDSICDYLGIDHKQFMEWKQAGEAYLISDTPPHHAPYGEFVVELKRAIAEYRLVMIERLHKKGNLQWFRDLMVLERRDRRNWGKNDPFGGMMDTTPPPDEKFL